MSGAGGELSEVERRRLVDELRQALHGSERRFDAIVGSLADAVTIRDRENRIVYANGAALRQLGFDSWEHLRETPPDQIMSDYAVFGEDGSPIVMDDIPSVRILRGEPADPLLIRSVNRDTNVERWQLLKAAPLLDGRGEIEQTIMIIEDVTEQKRVELRGAFLARASAELVSSLDYAQTLRNVAQLAVPDVADWCAVDLLNGYGGRETVAVAHADPARLSLAEELRRYIPEQLDPESGSGMVVRTGVSQLYSEISDEMLSAGAIDERHLELLRAAGFRTALIVPMGVGGRVLGTMTLVGAESTRLLDNADLELAEQLAGRAAVAIENSRLYSERSRIARTLQQSLLPEELPAVPGYELASMYSPALEASLVGGDFYDVWQAGEDWMVLIGDVTGKGVEAAALTALVRHTFRAASEFETSPAALLALVDRTLKKRPTLSLCTALCLRLSPHGATLAVGGHPLPLCLRGGAVIEVGEYGPLLGGFTGVAWAETALDFTPGSTLLLYTDGITEARSERAGRYGVERLRMLLARNGREPVADLLDTLTSELAAFQGDAQGDDTAALALRRIAADGTARAPELSDERAART
jgi:serine phosphatase RsbU (regulator of sigma subunit)